MRNTETHVYFYGGIYSNWYGAEFIDPITKINFANTEQAFMYLKADAMKDEATKRLINSEPNPQKVKALGRQITNYDDALWNKLRYDAMVYVNKLKFEQNPDLLKELLATGDKIMVEGSPYDKIWGVGLATYNDDILDETKWLGTNLLGKVLMDVRKFLKNKTN